MTHLRVLTSILAAAVLAIGLVAGSSGAAYANKKSEIDVRGDAPPALDVTKVGSATTPPVPTRASTSPTFDARASSSSW